MKSVCCGEENHFTRSCVRAAVSTTLASRPPPPVLTLHGVEAPPSWGQTRPQRVAGHLSKPPTWERAPSLARAAKTQSPEDPLSHRPTRRRPLLLRAAQRGEKKTMRDASPSLACWPSAPARSRRAPVGSTALALSTDRALPCRDVLLQTCNCGWTRGRMALALRPPHGPEYAACITAVNAASIDGLRSGSRHGRPSRPLRQACHTPSQATISGVRLAVREHRRREARLPIA